MHILKQVGDGYVNFLTKEGITEKSRAIVESIWSQLTWTQRQAAAVVSKINFFNIPERYLLEIRIWSHNTGIQYKKLYLANTIYDANYLAKIYDKIWCTSVAHKNSNGRYIHYRVMDWPIDELTDSHIEVNHVRSKFAISYRDISYPGMIGVITGVSDGESENVAISMNMDAETSKVSLSGTPVPFIIRECLESRGYSIKAVVSHLLKRKAFAPAFVHVTSKNHSVVIHMKYGGNEVVRSSDKTIVAVTNYIPSHSVDKCERYRKVIAISSDDMLAFLCQPVMNVDTKYIVSIDPAKSKIKFLI